ncbi:MAG: hypothetical protein ABSA33_03175 [Candidatus Micrarchaeaceae archaeon]|jgi:hypothetical protein
MEKASAKSVEPKENFTVSRLDKPLQKQMIDGVLVERFEVALKVDVYSITRLGNLPAMASAELAFGRLERNHDLVLSRHPELQNVYKFKCLVYSYGEFVPVEAYMYRNPASDSNELVLRTKTFASSNADKEGQKLACELLATISNALKPVKARQREQPNQTAVQLRA